MSTPTHQTYPLYKKASLFWGYNLYYRDTKSGICYDVCSRITTKPTASPDKEEKIGSITYYETLPEQLPLTTRSIYTLASRYIEQTTDPHIYIFYKKYKFLAIITLDDPDNLKQNNILSPGYENVSPIQSTTAVIFQQSTNRVAQERNRISLFDTNDRINYREEKNVVPLGYNAVLRTDLLPPDRMVWNTCRFCKFSESDSSRATFLIDENDLKIMTMLFIADKKTNNMRSEIVNDVDFMDIVANYLDDDTADDLAVIKPSDNLAYTDTKMLKSKTFYCYKGELING